MADYIYLLESRLSQAQQRAIQAVREIARARGLTIFLVGGAVRDLTSGSPVRDLDVVVQGNALKLKKDLEKAGAVLTGETDAGQALFVRFPDSVRMEVGSTLAVHFPKPGKPVARAATILDDLRRRDFTANAMALSLNEGSYGLLMDPLNGVADIENRELRLVSNYGFIEDPVRMIRATRFAARLGWQLEEKTRARYEAGKAEGTIALMQAFHRGYEAEEIVHEEDPLRVMRGLEQEGWMKHLAPGWSSARANAAELEKLREAQMQLQMRGIVANPSAAQFTLLTAKMPAKEVEALKQSFPRQGFVQEIEALEGEAKRFAAELGSRHVASASAAWKLLQAARPEVVLWVAYSTRNAGLLAKFASFYTEWPQARQKIPYALMQEMRIVPGLAGYDELVERVFFELMDGRLGTVEEMKAYLEPYSPPAPPPPVHLKRARGTKKDAKAAKTRRKAEEDAEAEEASVEETDNEGFDPSRAASEDGDATGDAIGDAMDDATGDAMDEATGAAAPEAALPEGGEPGRAAGGSAIADDGVPHGGVPRHAPAAAPSAEARPQGTTAGSSSSESKPAEASKPTGSKPAGSKPAESKPTGSKPASPAAAAKQVSPVHAVVGTSVSGKKDAAGKVSAAAGKTAAPGAAGKPAVGGAPGKITAPGVQARSGSGVAEANRSAASKAPANHQPGTKTPVTSATPAKKTLPAKPAPAAKLPAKKAAPVKVPARPAAHNVPAKKVAAKAPVKAAAKSAALNSPSKPPAKGPLKAAARTGVAAARTGVAAARTAVKVPAKAAVKAAARPGVPGVKIAGKSPAGGAPAKRH